MITSFHAKYFSHELTQRHGANNAGRLSQSLFDAGADLNPHQIEAALFALDYENLKRVCDKLTINPADSEFDVVYINGDHNIPAVFTSLETEGGITRTLKIRQIEPEFLNRMFAMDGV